LLRLASTLIKKKKISINALYPTAQSSQVTSKTKHRVKYKYP